MVGYDGGHLSNQSNGEECALVNPSCISCTGYVSLLCLACILSPPTAKCNVVIKVVTTWTRILVFNAARWWWLFLPPRRPWMWIPATSNTLPVIRNSLSRIIIVLKRRRGGKDVYSILSQNSSTDSDCRSLSLLSTKVNKKNQVEQTKSPFIIHNQIAYIFLSWSTLTRWFFYGIIQSLGIHRLSHAVFSLRPPIGAIRAMSPRLLRFLTWIMVITS